MVMHGENTDPRLIQTRLSPVSTPAEREDLSAPPAYTPTYTPPQKTNPEDVKVQVQSLPEEDGLIVTVKPPLAPLDEKLSHVPCDIVLVIDVSGSMSDEARIPGGSDQESTGLSVLDLVKHACRTILSTLDESDRLAIITFSTNVKEVQSLTAMNDANKKTAEGNIDKMSVQGATNLWAGLRKGIECLSNEPRTSRVPAIMLLTDGLPNHMCPPGGYVPALRKMGTIIPTIHTFGFGFQLRSGLLKTIAELGRGNYSFIPDAGMIGTVFVHAVAHLQSTFATNAVLRVTYPEHMTIEQTSGISVDGHELEHVAGSQNWPLTIPLGNIQYGQSRDVFLRCKGSTHKQNKIDEKSIQVTVTYDSGTKTEHALCTSGLKASELSLTPAEIAYHISRHRVLAFLASLFPLDALGEHRTCIPAALKSSNFSSGKAIMKEEEPLNGMLWQKLEDLRALADSLPAADFPKDSQCASLMQDLIGAEPFGQISLALSKQRYFERWGQHYLPSIHGAHARQLCNSFKDPGPLEYGVRSPLFIKCRDALNKAFDDLPPPTPSVVPDPEPRLPRLQGPRPFKLEPFNFDGSSGKMPDGGDLLRSQTSARTRTYNGRQFKPSSSMRDWNNSSTPCFAGRTLVTLANGTRVRISALQRGISVATPTGPRKVATMLVTPVKGVNMVRLEGVLVTPWHPVTLAGRVGGSDESSGWMFPCQASQESVRFTGCIYSVLLQRDESLDAHAIMLGGGKIGIPFWGVTLGHGMLTGSDVRAHCFFGDYKRVITSLKKLRVRNDGRVVTGGTKRSTETGLVCGFEAYAALKPVRGSRVYAVL